MRFLLNESNKCIQPFNPEPIYTYKHNTNNYRIVNNKAYTEDDVVVFNIFIYKIPRWIRQQDIHQYFTKFGEIMKTHIIPEKRYRKYPGHKVAFVNFINEQSAAAALKQKHFIKGHRVYAKACDSWRQPWRSKYGEDQLSLSSSNSNNETDIEINKILILNNDCLEHIIKFLSLKERIYFARTCPRFRYAFELFSRLGYRQMKLGELESLTLWDIHDVFQIAGPYMRTIDGILPYKDRLRILEFIGNSCSKLDKVILDSTKLKGTSLGKLLSKLNNITVLELHDCCLNDNTIIPIKQLRNLTKLTLNGNYEITGRHFVTFSCLTELSLCNCSGLQTTFMIEMLQQQTELRLLDVRRCENLRSDFYSALGRKCLNLEILKVSCLDSNYEAIAQITTLKSIEFSHCNDFIQVRVQFFTLLAENLCDKLETLIIHGRNVINTEVANLIGKLKKLKHFTSQNNEDLNDDSLRELSQLSELEDIVIGNSKFITNQGLLSLIRYCTKLKNVNIQHCNLINDRFIYETLEILKKRKPLHLLTLHALETGISFFVNNDQKVLDCDKYIKILFDEDLEHDSFDIEDYPYYDSDLELFNAFEDVLDDDPFDDDDANFFFGNDYVGSDDSDDEEQHGELGIIFAGFMGRRNER